jgi:hypothetical protein
LSRGDLTEVEWRILRVLPVERKPGKRGRGRPPESQHHQRHLMAASHRAVARCAGKVREMELDLSAFPALERLRCVGECGHRARRDHGRERALRHRQHYGSRPCIGGGRKRGIHQRALGRSRGGFTKRLKALEAKSAQEGLVLSISSWRKAMFFEDISALVGSAISNPSAWVHGRDMASPRSCCYWPYRQGKGSQRARPTDSPWVADASRTAR